ncbi:phage major tail tube protein [Prosthecochloris sp.]|uniref:phage major tail tube protein n=1 Tax=Prosthecochloris sp. TaxID=290513 RepID=UPI0025E8CCE6|nr:phage major tail tube protein [Prosthecochloris sp.]
MPQQIEIKRLTNANVYIDGNSLLGKVDECKLPEVNVSMSEHKALGMQGKLEFPSGIDKMEATFKWNSLYPDVLTKIANPFKAAEMQVRGALATYGNAGRTDEVPVVVYLTGSFKKFPMGGFKQSDNVEAETAMSVTYCKMEIDGQVILEVDALANIYKIGEVDLLEAYKKAIGG